MTELTERAVLARVPSLVDERLQVVGRREPVTVRLDDSLLDAAGILDARIMRSLDAIHLSAALQVVSDLEAVITYDRRMADAARLLGLTVISPA